MSYKMAIDLREGDRFITHGTVVTVLHDATHTTALETGRPGVTVWGEREDTGARGSMAFGQHASVMLADQEER